MANRNTLSIKHIDSFREWLVSDGFVLHEPNGDYEVVRAVKEGRRHPLIVYKRLDPADGKRAHYTVADMDMGTVRAFLRSRRKDND